MAFKFIILTACFAATAWAYSGGAPEGVCDDMTPKHPVDPQSSKMPYTISVDEKSVKPGAAAKITISGAKPFKGYLLQVREGDKPVGSFKISGDDRFSKTINCGKGASGMGFLANLPVDENLVRMVDRFLQFFGISMGSGTRSKVLVKYNAATHKNSSDKNNLVLEWRAPRVAEPKTYTVFATVAENGGVFWAKQPTVNIQVS